jgi:hypothetical protein
MTPRRPILCPDFALGLALARGGAGSRPISAQTGRRGRARSSSSVRPVRRARSVARLSSQLSVSASLLQRSGAEPDPSCHAVVPGVEAHPVGDDKLVEGTARPSTAAPLVEEPLLVRPYDRAGVASSHACGLTVIEQRRRFTGRLIDASESAAASVDEPRRQVPHVDHLGWQFGGVGDQHSAARCARPGKPQQPVPSPVEDVARPPMSPTRAISARCSKACWTCCSHATFAGWMLVRQDSGPISTDLLEGRVWSQSGEPCPFLSFSLGECGGGIGADEAGLLGVEGAGP